jgi:hypothetical protein
MRIWAGGRPGWRERRESGPDVYAYFNDDADGNAVYNSRRVNEICAP